MIARKHNLKFWNGQQILIKIALKCEYFIDLNARNKYDGTNFSMKASLSSLTGVVKVTLHFNTACRVNYACCWIHFDTWLLKIDLQATNQQGLTGFVAKGLAFSNNTKIHTSRKGINSTNVPKQTEKAIFNFILSISKINISKIGLKNVKCNYFLAMKQKSERKWNHCTFQEYFTADPISFYSLFDHKTVTIRRFLFAWQANKGSAKNCMQ